MLPTSVSLKFLPISISIDVLTELFKDMDPIHRISITGSSQDSAGRYCEATITFGPGTDANLAVDIFRRKVRSRIGEMYVGSEPEKIRCQVLSETAALPNVVPIPRPGPLAPCTRMTVSTQSRKRKGCVSLSGQLMVRFAIVPACNVLNLEYRPTMGLYRTNNEGSRFNPWLLPGSYLPCPFQSTDEVFEIRNATDLCWQSNLTDVITLDVVDSASRESLYLQISKSSKCFLIPTYFGDMVQSTFKMNSYTVMTGRVLIDTSMTVEEAGLEDGDTVTISPNHHTPYYQIDPDPIDSDPIDSDPVDSDPGDSDPADPDPGDSDPADPDSVDPDSDSDDSMIWK